MKRNVVAFVVNVSVEIRITGDAEGSNVRKQMATNAPVVALLKKIWQTI